MSREKTLVSTDWVLENLNNPSVVLVEVDEDTTLYQGGHI
ncbi:MAG: sulfurtransferase, partial [Candidatus Planktophila sp.]